MPALLPHNLAARELGKDPSTLIRWVKKGAPVARRGHRGKNGAALYDVDAIRAWRVQQSAQSELVETSAKLIADLPGLIGKAFMAQFCATTGPHKQQLASELAAACYRLLTSLEDYGIVAPMPAEFERLRLIAH
jgi:phage terminase Nu1 subunit (DNA packaging protein)